jgi:hypothetical protein
MPGRQSIWPADQALSGIRNDKVEWPCDRGAIEVASLQSALLPSILGKECYSALAIRYRLPSVLKAVVIFVKEIHVYEASIVGEVRVILIPYQLMHSKAINVTSFHTTTPDTHLAVPILDKVRVRRRIAGQNLVAYEALLLFWGLSSFYHRRTGQI